MSKIDDYIESLETLGDGRYHYYDGSPNGIGCSEYTRLALLSAGIINPGESFHAASAYTGVLDDTSRFQKIPWSASNLQRGDIMWSNGHHVATWDGVNGVYEAAPENSHGICDNGKTGVGHWSKHTYYNCGTGTKSWSWLYRILDPEEQKDLSELSNFDVLVGFLPTVKYGSNGTYVKILQAILKKHGWYSDVIDGNAGRNTVNGIKLMQASFGETASGVVDKQWWAKILK